MAIYRGIVREVYEIAAWLPAGSTMTGLGTVHNKVEIELPPTPTSSNRFEFVGRIAEDSLRKCYLGKSVRNYFPASSQNPIRYASL